MIITKFWILEFSNLFTNLEFKPYLFSPDTYTCIYIYDANLHWVQNSTFTTNFTKFNTNVKKNSTWHIQNKFCTTFLRNFSWSSWKIAKNLREETLGRDAEWCHNERSDSDWKRKKAFVAWAWVYFPSSIFFYSIYFWYYISHVIPKIHGTYHALHIKHFACVIDVYL